MGVLIQDLFDTSYMNGFLTFVAQPFGLALYVAVILGAVYLSGVFATALVIRFVQWALKLNINDSEYSKYWVKSWFGFFYFIFNVFVSKKHKLN